MLLVTVVLWSMSGLFVKLSTLNPIGLAGGRSLVTALLLWLWIRNPRFSWSRTQILAALCMMATFMMFITATTLTTAANAIFLQYTAPLWVALFSGWYLGEKTHSWDWWIMGVIVVGMALFFGERLSPQGLAGNILAIVSGFTMAWMTLLLRKDHGNAGETILLGNIFTAVLGVPVLLWQVSSGSVPMIEWGYLLFMGVFQLGIPFILYSMAIVRLGAVETILITTLEPILNPIWVFLVLGERPGGLALVGGLIVIGAVTVRSLIAGGVLQVRGAPETHSAGRSAGVESERLSVGDVGLVEVAPVEAAAGEGRPV
jgi:drug/metabolite transporter (DMT)-like permease